ncbi:MAG: (Fe-S)-binding protein [Thermodesulfobacteriota bacterium]
MAKLIVFPDSEALSRALHSTPASDLTAELLEVPSFCRGIAPPSLVVSGNVERFLGGLRSKGIPVSGVIAYSASKRDAPAAPPADPTWKECVGGLRVVSLRRSLSDPRKLRLDAAPIKPLGDLVGIMARIIRGGSYRPARRILAFEEDQRLVVITSTSLSFCRTEDLLDTWIMLRTAVELIRQAWENRHALEPERHPRSGLGANEIFRRLPGSNCGRCGATTCMEFALGIFTTRRTLEDCPPLLEESNRALLESARWVLDIMGLPSDLDGHELSHHASQRRFPEIRVSEPRSGGT